MQNAQEIGNYFINRLRSLDIPLLKEVRGMGLMIGVELTVEVKHVITDMMDHGLLAVPAGTRVVRFLPPLNITRDEVDEAIQKFRLTLDNIKLIDG